ncbi:MAG: hypothetical protein NTX44_01115 [Ignavibacteriales bacterium]|nr:hypothetical protein [Ignavibacteriales bacterium]
MDNSLEHNVETLIKGSFGKNLWLDENDKEKTSSLLLKRISDKKQTHDNQQIVLVLLTVLCFFPTVMILIGNYHSTLPELFVKIFQCGILMSILFIPISSVILIFNLKEAI